MATDGRRLALSTNTALQGVKDFRVIIPSKILNELVKLLGINKPTEDDFIDVNVSKNQVSFSFKETIFISRLIEGNFPSYEQVIPSKKEFSLSLEVGELLSSTKRAALCAGDLGGTVKYSLSENKIKITSTSAKMDFSEELKIDYDKEDFSTSFNPEYLIDVLKLISGKAVFSFNNAAQPVLVEEEGKTQYKYVIMPVRA